MGNAIKKNQKRGCKRCPSNKWWRMLLALCMVIGVVGVAGACRVEEGNKGETAVGTETNLPNPTKKTGAIATAVYPKGYDFADYNTKEKILTENPVTEKFEKGLSEFCYNTASKVLCNNEENRNMTYSPLSLYYALSMAGSGAEEQTQQEIFNLLGMDSKEELEIQAGNLYRRLFTDNEIGKLLIANSIWMDSDLNGAPVLFLDKYTKSVAENFYASSFSVDFADEATTSKQMSDWISENTKGLLQPTISTDPNQVLSILNTIYFYDQWSNGFFEGLTQDDIYHTLDGDVTVPFMNAEYGSHYFVKGNGYTQSALGLKNGASMVFILPDEGVSVSELLVTPEKMKELFSDEGGRSGDVTWKVPKFDFSSKMDLVEPLKSLGMEQAFSDDADFSGITDTKISISSISQEAKISINEKGVEAAAYTEMSFASTAMPTEHVDMSLDRPFIFGIRNDSGVLYFVGVCNNPAEK